MPDVHDLGDLLRKHPFFADMEAGVRDTVAGCAVNQRYQPGDFIFREGGNADRFYLLRDGGVALQLQLPICEPLVIDTLQAGEVFGWAWMVPPFRWTMDARATGEVRLLSLDAACLRGKCERDHGLGYELHRRFIPIMSRRLEATRLRLVDMYATPSCDRGR